MKKILITGTGRCGTTFLIKLLTLLGLDTGYPASFQRYVDSRCNSGMERSINDPPYVLKNPNFLESMASILQTVDVEHVILPLRDFEMSARSRALYQNHAGGFWNATTPTEQVDYYHKIISEYVLLMAQHDIPTIFLDFQRMVTDPMYLYQRLLPILTRHNHDLNHIISFDEFVVAYDTAQSTSRPARTPVLSGSDSDRLSSEPLPQSVSRSVR